MFVKDKTQYKEAKKDFVPKADIFLGTCRPYDMIYFNDNRKQLFIYNSDILKWKKCQLINYDDIFKVVPIGEFKDKKGHPLLRSAVGATLAGDVGAVVGALTTKNKSKGIITKLQFDIYLKDKSIIKENLISPYLPTKVNSSTGKQALKDFDNWKSKFSEIMNLSKLESSQNSQTDEVEQLKQLKSLVDQGVITQDEFEAKKKKILGI